MLQCECVADEVMPDCPIHGERPIAPPEYREKMANSLAPQSITCPKCSKTSYNPNDVEQGYCGNCHAFTAVLPIKIRKTDSPPGTDNRFWHAKNIQELLCLYGGAASVCWEKPWAAGLFDSEEALRIVEEAEAKLYELIKVTKGRGAEYPGHPGT